MLNKIMQNIMDSVPGIIQTVDPSSDDINLCLLVTEIYILREKIMNAENCLYCTGFVGADEVITKTLKILGGE